MSDLDTNARMVARVTIARECAALEAGVTEGTISAYELEERRGALIQAINLLIRLTQ